MINKEFLEKISKEIHPYNELIGYKFLEWWCWSIIVKFDVRFSNWEIKSFVFRKLEEKMLKNFPNITLKEFLIHNFLMDLKFPIPKAFIHDNSWKILKSPYLVIEYLEWLSLDKIDNIESYIKQIFDIIINLQKINTYENNFNFLENCEELLLKNIQIDNFKNNEDIPISEIFCYIDKFKSLVDTNKKCIIHWDIRSWNILVKDWKIISIIDWEDCGIWVPAIEFSNTRLELLLIHNYRSMEKLTKLVLRKSWIMPIDLYFWDLVIVIKHFSRFRNRWLTEKEEIELIKKLNIFTEIAMTNLDYYS